MTAADRAPADVVRASRSMTTGRHPAIAATIGVWTGLALAALVRNGEFVAAIAVALAVGAAMYGYQSEAFTRWTMQRHFRRRMTEAGWCWYCHGAHVAKHCPERGGR